MISVVNGSPSATFTNTTTPTTTITTTAPFQAPISLLTLFSGTPSSPRPFPPPPPTPPPRPSALPTHSTLPSLLNHIRTISWTTTTAIFGLLLATLILCDTVCFCNTDTIRRFPYAPRVTPLPPSFLLTLLCGRIPAFTTITTVRPGTSFVLFYAFATFCHLHLLFLLFD